MNYLPFTGSWFYGSIDGEELASLYCSYGLLFAAPGITPSRGFLGNLFGTILGG